MKVFTSPVLRLYGGWLVALGKRDTWLLRPSCLREFVDAPKARYYDVQLSRQQWADESGIEVVLRYDGYEWLWHTRDADPMAELCFTAGVDAMLTKRFGEPRAWITVYWRLRYWDWKGKSCE